MKTIITYLSFILFFISCNKTEILDSIENDSSKIFSGNKTNSASIPKKLKLSTSKTSFITSYTALSGGIISNINADPITTRGVCYSQNPNPTILNDKIISGSGTGTFSSAITGLIPGTSYFVRAFATNNSGTTYGSHDKFTTLTVGNAPFKLVYVSGNAQTYGGGGLPFPMVFRVLNTTTNTYLTDLFSYNLTITSSSNVNMGYEDAAFQNGNDYCNDLSNECFGGYYYIPPNNAGPFTLVIKVSLKDNGNEIDYNILTENIN